MRNNFRIIFKLVFHLTMVSKAFTCRFHVGVLKIFQNGIFSSSTGIFLKNVINAFISLCVSAFALSSKQCKRTSNATRAIAVVSSTNNKIVYHVYFFTFVYLLHFNKWNLQFFSRMSHLHSKDHLCISLRKSSGTSFLWSRIFAILENDISG